MMILPRKRSFWVVFLTLFASASNAADLWREIDEKTHQSGVCEAFVDKATYVFKHRSCSLFGCDEWLYHVTTFCGPASDGSLAATVEHSKNGRVFSREVISESRWKMLNGNLLRMKAANAVSFGKEFFLESVEQMSDGRLRVDYSISTNGKTSEKGYWIFGEGPCIPQVQERLSTTLGPLAEETSDFFIQ